MEITNGKRLAWAIGKETRLGFSPRRIVWGRLLARHEKRPDEKVVRVIINAYE